MQGSEVVSVDIGSASALALYNYQTTLNGYNQGATASATTGTSTSSSTSPATSSSSPTSTASDAQDAAVLQALASAYTSLTTNSNGILPAPDALSAAAGTSGALGSLVSGIYAEAVASGKTALNLSSLSASAASVGGLNASTASILFAGNPSNGLDNISSSAINLNATLALASYSNHLKDIPNSSATVAATGAAAGTDSTQPADVQNAILSAQSASFNSTLNLFA
jgi:peptidoglycan DL-endopeptidase CwlO